MGDYKQNLERAARYCSGAERCSSDMHQKLESWGINPEETARAIKFLVDNKFIDDDRYARMFAREKLSINKWGRIKIIYALKQKKISEHTIAEAISELDQELYDSILKDLIRSKIKSVGSPSNYSNKAKIIRFAAQRGFTSEEIYAALEKL